eukprot:TRINITY_DN49383_c0_g1_i1.p1 TRINITY_DN49383_c0_g1~~TRINITY_DN49383_c0_g1_i1.p1  ORF type:complete len:115 (+),score=9.58 TRINITY_DN49383_c0_g1_i1:395-739(+)
MIVNLLKPGCVKAGDTISHYCNTNPNVCASSPFGGLVDDKIEPYAGGVECQTVPAGGVAYFIIKDGDGCESGATSVPIAEIGFTGGTSASCSPSTEADSTCVSSNSNSLANLGS